MKEARASDRRASLALPMDPRRREQQRRHNMRRACRKFNGRGYATLPIGPAGCPAGRLRDWLGHAAA